MDNQSSSFKSSYIKSTVLDYLVSHSLNEDEDMRRIRKQNENGKFAHMQIRPEQGQFLGLICRLINPRRVLEIGTFTGYSTTWIAKNCPEDVRIIACEASKEWAETAQHNWKAANVSENISLELGKAEGTIVRLVEAIQGSKASAELSMDLEISGSKKFDLIFIDADKLLYDFFYEQSLLLLRTGGLIIFDNVLWFETVTDPNNSDKSTEALRKLNLKLHQDPRVQISMIPLGDGMTLAVKL